MNGIKKFIEEYGPGASLLFLILLIWFFVLLALCFEMDILGIDFYYIEDYLFACCFSATIFLGICAEIVHLLYQNNKKQDIIISLLKNNTASGKTAQKAILEDIESNLPEM
ncbi:MAG: hypothetical protein ACI4IW_08120 [Oscillospiraceae bacterium]